MSAENINNNEWPCDTLPDWDLELPDWDLELPDWELELPDWDKDLLADVQ